MGVTVLPNDIDQFVVDLYGFFKLSSVHCRYCFSMEELTSICCIIHQFFGIKICFSQNHRAMGKTEKNISSVSYQSQKS